MSRPRLAQSLARGLAGRLLLLVAPAGYGKTTLLASMAADWHRFANPATATRLAWYQVGPADDDAAVLFEGLVESVRRVAPGFGKLALAALRGAEDPRGRLDCLMAVFLDELREAGEGRIFLVLDGFHHITDRAVLETLERSLLDRNSPLRLILSARSDPRFYLSVFRSRDELVELRADDLRFNLDEMRDLIYQHSGQRFSQRVAEEVLKATGGWPSAANLAALVVAREGGSLPCPGLAPTEHGYRVLVREVLAGLPPRKREMVVRSALPRDLEPAAFQEGMESGDLPEVLRLVREVSLPAVESAGPDSPLRYEPLFKSALEKESTNLLLPRELRALQRKLSAHYAERGEEEEAVQGFLQAEAFEDAAALTERIAAQELSVGHLDRLLRWIRALPAAARRMHPRLTVYEGRMLLARGRFDEARALLAAVRQELEAVEDQEGLARRSGALASVHLLDGHYPLAQLSARESLEGLPETEPAERAEVYWWLSRAHELMGDLAAAHTAAGEGLLAAERSGRWALVIRAMLQLGELAYLRGDFSESLAVTGRAVQRSVLLGTEALSSSLAGGTASAVYRERDYPAEAARVAEDALKIARRLYDVTAQAQGRLALAAALERLGEQDAALTAFEEVAGLLKKLPPRRVEHTLALQIAAASLLRRGRRREGLQRAKLALEAALASTHQVLVAQCRLMLVAGELASPVNLPALIRVRRLRDALARSDSRQWLSASLRLMAQSYQGLGLGWRARANLEKSLALAAGEGYVGMPLGLPSERERLLRMAVRKGVAVDVAGTLLGVDAATGDSVLDPLMAAKDARVRARAEQAGKGIDMGSGRVPVGKLLWPALPEAETGVAPRVSLRSLGGLDGHVEGQTARWPSEDARNVAAYLLVHRGRSVPRERALRDLWPRVEPWAANLRMQVALYRLRETLGPGYQPVDLPLESRGFYRWGGAGCWVDAEQFRRKVARTRQLLPAQHPLILPEQPLALLEDAADLYRGEFLAGIDFDWCTLQREDLRSQLLWVARLLVDHFMAKRDWGAAIGYGLQSLRSDPLQEDVVRDVMLCYYRMGDRNAVLQQYRELKRLLARLRGVWPSDETRQLRVKLLGK